MAEQPYELDIDRERIRIDDEWLSVSDLMARIKVKIEAGDFRVSRLSGGLEQLEASIASIRTLTLKVTPELLETYERMASAEGVPATYVLRRALVHYLGSDEGAGRLYRARRDAPAPRPSAAEPPPIPAEAASTT